MACPWEGTQLLPVHTGGCPAAPGNCRCKAMCATRLLGELGNAYGRGAGWWEEGIASGLGRSVGRGKAQQRHGAVAGPARLRHLADGSTGWRTAVCVPPCTPHVWRASLQQQAALPPGVKLRPFASSPPFCTVHLARPSAPHLASYAPRTGTCILFGDGCGAVVLRASDDPSAQGAILGMDMGSDGNGHKSLNCMFSGA